MNGALTDLQTGITVSADSAASLVVTGYPDPIGLNTTGSVTVTAKDASNNTAVGYSGTVHLSTSGGTPTLPANYTFKASDNGVHVFSGIAFGAPEPGRSAPRTLATHRSTDRKRASP